MVFEGAILFCLLLRTITMTSGVTGRSISDWFSGEGVEHWQSNASGNGIWEPGSSMDRKRAAMGEVNCPLLAPSFSQMMPLLPQFQPPFFQPYTGLSGKCQKNIPLHPLPFQYPYSHFSPPGSIPQLPCSCNGEVKLMFLPMNYLTGSQDEALSAGSGLSGGGIPILWTPGSSLLEDSMALSSCNGIESLYQTLPLSLNHLKSQLLPSPYVSFLQSTAPSTPISNEDKAIQDLLSGNLVCPFCRHVMSLFALPKLYGSGRNVDEKLDMTATVSEIEAKPWSIFGFGGAINPTQECLSLSKSANRDDSSIKEATVDNRMKKSFKESFDPLVNSLESINLSTAIPPDRKSRRKNKRVKKVQQPLAVGGGKGSPRQGDSKKGVDPNHSVEGTTASSSYSKQKMETVSFPPVSTSLPTSFLELTTPIEEYQRNEDDEIAS